MTPPEPKLRPYFSTVSTADGSVVAGKQTSRWIDLTLMFDKNQIDKRGMKQWPKFKAALIEDAARRLGAAGILYGSYTDIEHDDRVVFRCKKASAAKIKKFVAAWTAA